GATAVAIHAPRATYLCAGDAAYQSWEYRGAHGRPGLYARLLAHDRHELRTTHERLRSCATTPGIVVVPAPDEGIFERLPHAPALAGAVTAADGRDVGAEVAEVAEVAAPPADGFSSHPAPPTDERHATRTAARALRTSVTRPSSAPSRRASRPP